MLSQTDIMVTLTVIREPPSGSYGILARCRSESAFVGKGSTKLACGACGLVLAEAVNPDDFHDVAFKCSCGEFNALRLKNYI